MLAIRQVLILFATIFLAAGVPALAQEPSVGKFNPNYQSRVAKAQQECAAMWGDHTFDPLRNKLPLGEQTPTISMLTNSEWLRAKEKTLVDLAIKTKQKCRPAGVTMRPGRPKFKDSKNLRLDTSLC
jgi:hypothetical protein